MEILTQAKLETNPKLVINPSLMILITGDLKSPKSNLMGSITGVLIVAARRRVEVMTFPTLMLLIASPRTNKAPVGEDSILETLPTRLTVA